MRYVIGLIVIALIAAAAFFMVGRDDDPTDTNTTLPPPTSQTTNGEQNNAQPEETNRVTISNLNFSPTDITVKKGATVTWTNNDSVAHTVRFESGGFSESQTLDNGDTHEITFNEVGTFNYICGIHPQMHGTVTVTE